MHRDRSGRDKSLPEAYPAHTHRTGEVAGLDLAGWTTKDRWGPLEGPLGDRWGPLGTTGDHGGLWGPLGTLRPGGMGRNGCNGRHSP